MPFSERSYYRGGTGSYFPHGVKWLLIVNVAIYLLFFFAARFGFDEIFVPFQLNPREVLGSLAIWQLVTYMFLHDPNGFSHILFNMLTLWMFGADLEGAWGTRQFLKYYFLCGIGAGVCVVIANILFVGGGPTIGASGAIYGLLLAFGMLYPDRQVLFSFLFPIKAKYFVMILGAIAFLSSLAAPGGPVSHVAHLGGMLFGFFYIRSQRRRSPQRLSRHKKSDPIAIARNWYREWRLQRARRKFEVYLKKHRDRDPFVH